MAAQQQTRVVAQQCLTTKNKAIVVPNPSVLQLDWSEDIKQWPPLKLSNIFEYLLDKKVCDSRESMNWKSVDSFMFVEADFVGMIRHAKNGNVHYVKGPVRPSQRSGVIYNPWASILQSKGSSGEETFEILGGSCSCMAGLGRSCSHVSALLYKICKYNYEGQISQTCTDKPCQWNAGKKLNVEADLLQNINFKKKTLFDVFDQKKKSVPPSKKKKDKILRKGQGNFYSLTRNEFQEHFETSDMAALMSESNAMFSNNFSKPITVTYHEHAVADKIDETCGKCERFYVKYVDLSKIQKLAIFEATRAQSESDVWKSNRLIRITGSAAGKVPKAANPEKFMHRHFHVPFKGNEATRHGHICEPIAIANLKRILDLDIIKCGSIISNINSWLSCSPDGIFDSDRKILEVKCPVKNIDLKSLNVKEETDSDNIKFYTLKPGGREYFLQVQLNMFCAETKSALFYVWCRDNDLLVNVPFDEVYTEREVERLKKFYFSYFLPRCADLFEQNMIPLCDEYLKICQAVK